MPHTRSTHFLIKIVSVNIFDDLITPILGPSWNRGSDYDNSKLLDHEFNEYYPCNCAHRGTGTGTLSYNCYRYRYRYR